MRIHISYLKALTQVFLNSSEPYISTDELDAAGLDITSKEGLFHYQLLIEQGYISDHKLNRDPHFLGLIYGTSVIGKNNRANLRLTTEGYEFAKSLEEPTVYEKLETLSEQPLSVIKDVGTELIKGYLKNKFGIQ